VQASPVLRTEWEEGTSVATAAQRFSVGVNYLPAPHDDAAVRDDFAHIAALSFDAVRVFVRWNELQPRAESVDAAALDRLERTVAHAAAAGLHVLPSLCGGIGEVSFMPDWANRHDDLYAGPLLDAQLRIAHAVAERLRDHPAVTAWDIGHAFSAVRAPKRGMLTSGEHASEPRSEPLVAAWSSAWAKALKAGTIRATSGAYEGDLLEDTSVRFGSLCAPLAFASIQALGERLPFARAQFDPEAIPFLAMLTAAFSHKPVLVTGAGNPTFPHVREDENASYASAVLERLHADGRLGVYWWCWNDEALRAPHEPSYGIVRAGGSEKPVAQALAAFAREQRTVRKPVEMPMISSTYYYRTLPDSTRTLYDAFLGFVAERRAGG
jgi:hypothetical protein